MGPAPLAAEMRQCGRQRLGRSFIPPHTGHEDRKYMKGVARTGRSWSATAQSCVGVEHQDTGDVDYGNSNLEAD